MRFLFFLLLLPLFSFSQATTVDSTAIDLKYREDQFYFGLTYNIIMDKPTDLYSRGLTGGISGGFLRDMPINKKRNLAIAAGIGLAYDQYGQNLFIGESPNGKSIFRIMDNTVDYTQNRLGMAMVELPLEFRWRTSTPTDYRFWRVYMGARLGYTYWYKATFKQSGNNVNQTDIPEFERLRLSATLSFGYSTFNLYAAYNILPFFKDAYTIDGEEIDFKTLKVGLIFYIL